MLLGAVVDTVAIGGTVASVVVFAGYLLRELNRSSGGAWRINRSLKGQLHRADYDVRYWRHRTSRCEGWLDPEPDPGNYQPPTKEELEAW